MNQNLLYLDNKSLYENLQLLQVSVEKMYLFMHGHKQQIAFSICMATALHSYPWANVIYALSSLTCGLYLHPLTVTEWQQVIQCWVSGTNANLKQVSELKSARILLG